MSRPQLVVLTVCLGLLGLVAWPALMVKPALAAYNTVAALFQAGHYDESRTALSAEQEGARPGEDILWQSRLSQDPAAALALLEGSLGDKRLSPAVRMRLALESADLQAGRGNHQAVMAILTPLLSANSGGIPGAAYLRAGLSLRALGDPQQAREMLASVRPDDPEFVLARYYLGDIGLEQNDPTLARRYFEAAAKASDEAGRSRLAAGTWQAFRTGGDDKQAEALVNELSAQDPGSLALLEIRRLLQMEADERQARTEEAPADTVVTRAPDNTGRYALQLGAFSDRGLALEFVKRYQTRLPELRIERLRDARGQFLYKVRTGDYVNPALARSEAKQLQRQLGIEVITADLAADTSNTFQQ